MKKFIIFITILSFVGLKGTDTEPYNWRDMAIVAIHPHWESPQGKQLIKEFSLKFIDRYQSSSWQEIFEALSHAVKINRQNEAAITFLRHACQQQETVQFFDKKIEEANFDKESAFKSVKEVLEFQQPQPPSSVVSTIKNHIKKNPITVSAISLTSVTTSFFLYYLRKCYVASKSAKKTGKRRVGIEVGLVSDNQ